MADTPQTPPKKEIAERAYTSLRDMLLKSYR